MRGSWRFALVLFLTAMPAVAQTVPSSRAEISLSFAPIVRETAPAVVSIYARRIVEERVNPFSNDPFFSQFFNDMGQTQQRIQNALGSGVVVSSDGIVVSNFHVVGNADDIRVVLDDRREFAADVLLQDEESDLAILQLREASDLPVVELADSDNVEVGDLVLAIGNPFGVGQTVSSGIVSALARSGIAVGSGRGYFIQTDAAINPGNSGGALVDMAGRLVGINTAILTRSGGSNGIGFAIPSNLVAQVIGQARNGESRFQRPWMGVTAQAVDASLAESFALGLPRGVVLTDLDPNSPLAEAGLKIGDVVLAVDGDTVNTPPEMMFRLAARGIGGTADLTVLSAGRESQVTVALIAPPETPPRNRIEVPRTALQGLAAVNINPAVAAEYNLPPGSTGVLAIEARDLASRVGMVPGDIIVGVNGAPIRDTDDLAEALSQRGRYWEIELIREGRRNLLRFRI
ncbi:MAG: Do family serine endopeptidase [Paracoccaceae bacterium]